MSAARSAQQSSVDPSRIIELPKAYAFAREKNLPLPAGLVAIRQQQGSLPQQKVGTFEYMVKTLMGGGTSPRGTTIGPALMVVLSVADGQRAWVIDSGRSFRMADGLIWRFREARLAGDELEWFSPSLSGQGGSTYSFKWKDANSGRVLFHSSIGGNTPFTNSFTRLDG
jgi:hypothetical protein